MQVDNYILNHWESSKERSVVCDYCGLKEKEPEFYLQSKSYYRYGNGSYYFFCSEECRTKYGNAHICRECGYGINLKKVDDGDYVLCTDFPGKVSCYDKVMGNTHLRNRGRCDFCQVDDADITMTKKVQNAHDNPYENYDEYRCCDSCFKLYCDIAANKRTEEEEIDVCEFCDREEDLCEINLYTLCRECREVYKLFVFGPDI